MLSAKKNLEILAKVEAEYSWYSTAWNSLGVSKSQPIFQIMIDKYCVVYDVEGKFINIVNWNKGDNHIPDEELASKLLMKRFDEVNEQKGRRSA